MAYRIIGDSCTDFSPEMLRDPHIVRVPLNIHLGPVTIVDDDTFDQAAFIPQMRAYSGAPKTSCPSPAQYMAQFIEGDNYVVTLSGNLSGSYNAAMQAKALYEEEGGKGNVYVFDSCSASAGQVQIALLALELAEKGLSFAEVVEQVNAYSARMETLFVLENLDNLRKNGRLTKMQSIVTGALRVKLLCAATPEGEIVNTGKGLTMKQTLAKMISKIASDPGHVGRRYVIAHVNCPERAQQVKEMAQERCQFSEILIVPTAGIATVYADDGGIVTAY